jgi:hypothetical protein
MKIHTIGDSHSYFGWSNVINHHLGPLLCYTFGKEKLKRCDIRNFNLSNDDIVIFCLGEIDCRCHIHKYINLSLSYFDIIDDIIKNYFESIKLNIEVSKLKLKHICVYNVVPPVQKCNTLENLEYPFLGSDDERKNYVLYFNKVLKDYCIEENYIFFDIYDKYIDENGFLNKQLSDNNVHIKNNLYIDAFIKKNLI